MLLHRLGQEPRVVRRLQREIDDVITEKGTPLPLEDLSRLPYLKATVAESHR